MLGRRNTVRNHQYFCICCIIAVEGCRNNKIKHKRQRNKVHKFVGRMLFWSVSFHYVIAKRAKHQSLFLDCNLQPRCVVARISQFSVRCYSHCRSRLYTNTQGEVVLLRVYDLPSVLLHASRRMTAVEDHTTICRASLSLFPCHSDLNGTYYFYVPSIIVCNFFEKKKKRHIVQKLLRDAPFSY